MRPKDVRIRLAGPADADHLLVIYGPHCTDGLASFETVAPTGEEMAERIRTTITTYPWLVAVDAATGEVVGYAYASRHRAREGYRWSVDVAVYLAARAAGRGLGRGLYERLLAVLEAQRYHRAYAGIALPNDASVALHSALGFEPVGTYREVGFKHGAWHDVQWWSRGLADSALPPTEPIALRDLPPAVLADLRELARPSSGCVG